MVETKHPDLPGYFRDDFVEIKFLKKNKMVLEQVTILGWTVTTKKGRYTWKFNKNKQALFLYLNEKLFSAFALVSNADLEIKSSHSLPAVKAIQVNAIRRFE